MIAVEHRAGADDGPALEAALLSVIGDTVPVESRTGDDDCDGAIDEGAAGDVLAADLEPGDASRWSWSAGCGAARR